MMLVFNNAAVIVNKSTFHGSTFLLPEIALELGKKKDPITFKLP